jgi:hypothetical protein
MLTSIGRILNGSPTPAGRAPVRRGSHLAGRHEATFWRATDRQEVRRIILAARRYELAERRRGRRNGPLGHVALEVLELLAHLVSYKTGRLEPSLEYLMRKLRRSKDAVVRALQVLAGARLSGLAAPLCAHRPRGQGATGQADQQRLPALHASTSHAPAGAPHAEATRPG